MNLRALIVDDERLSRLALRQVLATVPDVDVLAECNGIADAESMLAEVDVVFLDIQMPGQTGLSAARHWEASASAEQDGGPLIVFVTAFEQFALPAFDTAAIDYLTKPVRRARLVKALDRVRARLGDTRRRDDADAAAKSQPPLVTRAGDTDVVIPINRIDCVEADGVYAGVWTAQRRVLVRVSLDALEERLGAAGFVRVHRSWLVPLDRITAIKPAPRGRGRVLVLASGQCVPVSRRRLGGLRRSFPISPARDANSTPSAFHDPDSTSARERLAPP